MRTILAPLSGIFLAVLVIVPASAIRQGFRSRADLVRTDVTVIDNRTGKPVTGLTEQDFIVNENGVRQTISSFLAETGEAEGGRQIDGRRRSLLFVFPLHNRSATGDPHGDLADFLRTQLQPDDRAAIMVMGRFSPFTTDGDRLAKIIERLDPLPYNIWELWRRSDWREMTPELHAATDRWLDPDGGDPPFLKRASTYAFGTRPTERFHDNRLEKAISTQAYLQLASGIEYLRLQPGEKRLILIMLAGALNPLGRVNGIVDLDTDYEERRLAARIIDSDIALDIITTDGNNAVGNHTQNTQMSQNLTRLTGGLFTSTRTVAQQLRRIDDASRHGYVIGYVPTHPEKEGVTRHVEVTVNQRDVTVSHRKEYTVRAQPPPLDLRDMTIGSRMQAAAVARHEARDLTLKASASVADSSSRQVRVQLTMNAKELLLPVAEGRRETTLNVMILVGDSKQNVLGKFDREMTLSLDETQYQQVLATGLPYAVTIPVTARPEHVKVIVYQYDSDKLGSLSVRPR